MEEKRFCPHCLAETMQGTSYFDPDDPDGGEVWVCSCCLNEIDFVVHENFIEGKRTKEISNRKF